MDMNSIESKEYFIEEEEEKELTVSVVENSKEQTITKEETIKSKEGV